MVMGSIMKYLIPLGVTTYGIDEQIINIFNQSISQPINQIYHPLRKRKIKVKKIMHKTIKRKKKRK